MINVTAPPMRFYRDHYTKDLVLLEEVVVVARELLQEQPALEVPIWARRGLTLPTHIDNDTHSAYEVLEAAGYAFVEAHAVPDDVSLLAEEA